MKKIHCLVFSIAIACLSATARAQDDPAGGGGDRLYPALGRILDPAQRQSLQHLIGLQRVQIHALQEKIRASRQALLDQVAGGKFNEVVARQYAGESAKAEADLTFIFARALSQMQPRLSAQQAAQLKNFQFGRLHEAREGRFDDHTEAAPEVHLKLPPPLPEDSNGLPVVN